MIERSMALLVAPPCPCPGCCDGRLVAYGPTGQTLAVGGALRLPFYRDLPGVR